MALSQTADILRVLQDEQDRMVTLLRDLVELESPSHDAGSQEPVLAAITEELGQVGYGVERIEGDATGGHLVARPRSGPTGAFQLMVGHSDTVWPEGTLVRRPVTISDGVFRGPGAYDMKAGLVQAIAALRSLDEVGLEPEVTPVLFVNTDEEIGSRETRGPLTDLAAGADRALILEPSLGPEGRLKTSRKGVGAFTITITGEAAHAGLDPEKGASAILELSHVVQELFSLNDPAHGISVNVGTIEGGLRANVVAPQSRARVDARVLRDEDARRVESAIRSLVPVVPGTSMTVEGRFGRPPMERTDVTGRLFARAQEVGDELGIELTEGTAGGGSDGNLTCRVTPTLDGMGAVGDGAHAEHEYVLIDSMVERSALLAGVLMGAPCREEPA